MPPPQPIPLIHSTTHTTQAALSAYALYLSLHASLCMNRYTDTTKKAAKVSQTADDQLYRTRTTLASAVGASLVALAGGALPMLPFESTRRIPGSASSLLSAAMAVVVLVSARRYIIGFWEGKVDLPGVSGHNEALKSVRTLSVIMRWTVLVIGVGGAVDALGSLLSR